MLVAVAWLDVLGTERMQSGRQAWAACLCILCATVASNGMDRMICGLWRHSLIGEKDVTPPDKWEYPWYAAWELAFHCIGLALVDPDFAKHQLTLFLREWYMHPNGQIPAYEWS